MQHMTLREAAEAVVEKAGRPVHGEVFTVISYEHTEALRAALAEPDELAEAQARSEFAVEEAAKLMRLVMDLAPWLSASLNASPPPCPEYVALCDRVFAVDQMARRCLQAATEKSDLKRQER